MSSVLGSFPSLLFESKFSLYFGSNLTHVATTSDVEFTVFDVATFIVTMAITSFFEMT